MKRCIGCKASKPIDDFFKREAHDCSDVCSSQHQSRCKECDTRHRAGKAPKKASGAYVRDCDRNTVKRTLRLQPEIDERLMLLHREWKNDNDHWTFSDTLETLLDTVAQ